MLQTPTTAMIITRTKKTLKHGIYNLRSQLVFLSTIPLDRPISDIYWYQWVQEGSWHGIFLKSFCQAIFPDASAITVKPTGVAFYLFDPAMRCWLARKDKQGIYMDFTWFYDLKHEKEKLLAAHQKQEEERDYYQDIIDDITSEAGVDVLSKHAYGENLSKIKRFAKWYWNFDYKDYPRTVRQELDQAQDKLDQIEAQLNEANQHMQFYLGIFQKQVLPLLQDFTATIRGTYQGSYDETIQWEDVIAYYQTVYPEDAKPVLQVPEVQVPEVEKETTEENNTFTEENLYEEEPVYAVQEELTETAF